MIYQLFLSSFARPVLLPHRGLQAITDCVGQSLAQKAVILLFFLHFLSRVLQVSAMPKTILKLAPINYSKYDRPKEVQIAVRWFAASSTL